MKVECSLCSAEFDTAEPLWLDRKWKHIVFHKMSSSGKFIKGTPKWIKVWKQ